MRISDWSSDVCSSDLSPTCPRVHARHSRWMTVAEWKALGLTAVGKGWPADHLRATLIEADGPGGRAFLTFDNYRALLDYNCSNYRSEEHTSELQSLMRISYAVFCLKKKKKKKA